MTRPRTASGAVVPLQSPPRAYLAFFSIQDALSGFGARRSGHLAAFKSAWDIQTRLGERIAYLLHPPLWQERVAPATRSRARPIPRYGADDAVQHRARRRHPVPDHPECRTRVGSERPLTAAPHRRVPDDDVVLVVSAMFLTATAPNPLVAELTRQSSGMELSWMWAVAASRCQASWRSSSCRWSCTGCARRVLHDTSCTGRTSVCERWAARTQRAGDAGGLLDCAPAGLSAEWHGASPTAIVYLGLALLRHTRARRRGRPRREGGVGCVDLVRRQGQRQGRLAEGLCGRCGWPGRRVAVVVGACRADGRLPLLPLCVCEPVAHVTAMFPAFFAVAVGLGAPPLPTALGVLLEPQRRHHALRHGAGAHRVWRRCT